MDPSSTALFSSNLGDSMKRNYRSLLALKYSDKEAEETMVKFYENSEYIEDSSWTEFWIVLAALESKYGRLSKGIQKKALEVIESGDDLLRWNNLYERKKREKILSVLKNDLSGEQPERKEVNIRTIRCPWKTGDLLAYNIGTNPDMKDSLIWKKYALLRVVKITRCELSEIVPESLYDEVMVVGLYDWIGDSIPDASITSQLKFIPISITNPSLAEEAIQAALEIHGVAEVPKWMEEVFARCQGSFQ